MPYGASTSSGPSLIRPRSLPARFLPTQSQTMEKMPIATPECRLLRSSARSRDAKHHLRASVQLDILLGAEQDARSLSHPGILLPRRIIRQQHAGNRRGGDR